MNRCHLSLKKHRYILVFCYFVPLFLFGFLSGCGTGSTDAIAPKSGQIPEVSYQVIEEWFLESDGDLFGLNAQEHSRAISVRLA
jgi:hypothetical protein